MYVCSCFGITERQVRERAAAGAVTPRQIASECKAGTDCGSCVRRIQALLGRARPPAGHLCPQAEAAPAALEALDALGAVGAAGRASA
ncbi:(2Fe-2S)-binding protein [Streptomyces sp. 8K308]|uniref:(2Fe-2S)-binding protein n=1 Tax=Streptomyces sp. 8K308 TaxID=2530388 RepID=UPI001A9D5ACB|nr:(2Fe-2S)-binding protein [Streptomyces sp. 8K308]